LEPPLDQARIFPISSATEIIVLLKVEWI